MTDEAWAELHDATPPGWWVGSPSYHNERREWLLYAFDPSERAKVGLRSRSRSAVLPLLLALACVGCASQRMEPTEPTFIAEPSPGSFYLTSDPPLAQYPFTFRVEEIGGPSRRSEQFDEGDEVVINWTTLPLPEAKWIEVNGQDCEGTFGIEAGMETDLLLILTDDGCRVEVVGSHPVGEPRHRPGEQSSA